MKNENKRAVSPLIATVLLVLIVLVASGLVYAWSKSFIAEQLEKFGDPVETVCQKLDFDAQLEGSSLYINNRGNVQIHQVNVLLKGPGKSTLKPSLQPDDGSIAGGKTGTVTLSGLTGYDSVEVTPILLGRGRDSGETKLFPCKESAKSYSI